MFTTKHPWPFRKRTSSRLKVFTWSLIVSEADERLLGTVVAIDEGIIEWLAANA